MDPKRYPRGNGKRVTFTEPTDQDEHNFVTPNAENVEIRHGQFSSIEFECRWYGDSELRCLKTTARLIGSECRKYGYGRLLDYTLCKDTKEIQDALNQWSRHGHSRRGNEQWANIKHGQQRRSRNRAVIKCVLLEQNAMRDRGENNPEGLRILSEKLTFCSRRFAEKMGLADAHAVAFSSHTCSTPKDLFPNIQHRAYAPSRLKSDPMPCTCLSPTMALDRKSVV